MMNKPSEGLREAFERVLRETCFIDKFPWHDEGEKRACTYLEAQCVIDKLLAASPAPQPAKFGTQEITLEGVRYRFGLENGRIVNSLNLDKAYPVPQPAPEPPECATLEELSCADAATSSAKLTTKR